MSALRFNVDNEINFFIDHQNGDLQIEVDHKRITVPASMAQELLTILRTKQLEVFEEQKDNWFKKLFQ